jgi:hypothetical protein
MTIIMMFTPYGLAEAMRSLLPIMEPIVLAIASACGAGLLAQIGLGVGLRLARNALRA